MKKFLIFSAIVTLGVFSVFGTAGALSVELYVDSAPNASGGSPYYDAWQENAFAAAANGTFVNMANSINPANAGTTSFEIEDEVVYNFGDLGKRLHFIYWVPEETVASLTNNFEVSLFNVWDGDVMDYYAEYVGSTWLQPTRWIDYDSDGDGDTDGVIGTAGAAWWGAYGTNTPEALAADLAEWSLASESWIFNVKHAGEITSIKVDRAAVPEPSMLYLLGAGLVGLAMFRRKKRSKKAK